MHYYKFNIGDYASHTRHLSPIEDIAYRRLLDIAYTTEKPIKDDIRDISRLINLREFQAEIQDVLKEFWQLVDGEGWVNNRVFKEIENSGEKSAKASMSAKMRWDKIKQANAMREESERNANASTNNANAHEIDATHYPLPTTHYQSESNTLSGKPDDLLETPIPKKSSHTKEAQEVIEHLNLVTGSKFQAVDANIKPIVARIKEGATVTAIKRVIDVKAAAWINDPKMCEFLRPATLFNATNYANYAGQVEIAAPKKERAFVC